jgi:L-fuculose-phosphate aldolase
VTRESVIATALAMNERGINVGASGNVSIRTDDGMFITPSGVAYDQMTVADVVAVHTDTTWTVENDRLPSSEWRFHLDIYRHRPDVAAVLHAHPVNATGLAVHGRGIGPFHYMVGIAGGYDIRCARYATFGTQQLSDNVIAALESRTACLIEHHGMIAVGASLDAALSLAVEVEVLASQLIAALVIGEPAELTAEQMDEVLLKMQSVGYGSEPPGSVSPPSVNPASVNTPSEETL